MISYIKKLNICYTLYVIFFCNFAIASLPEESIDKEFQQACNYYYEERWAEAFEQFKVIQNLNLKAEAQKICGDICFMEKDKPHSLKEAALYYLLSAHGGNANTLNYIEESVPDIFSLTKPMQLEKLVNFWVNDATSRTVKHVCYPLLNSYLQEKLKYKYGETLQHKVPYFFHKALILLLNTHMFSEDQLKLKEKGILKFNGSLSCAMEEHSVYQADFIEPCATWKWGPVYPKNWPVVEKKCNNDKCNNDNTRTTVDVLYQKILDAFYAYDKKSHFLTAESVEKISHRDFPWIISGIQYFEYRHKKKLIPECSNEDLINGLRKAINENCPLDSKIKQVLEQVIESIENNSPFYNSGKNEMLDTSDEDFIERVNNEFQKNTILFFRSMHNSVHNPNNPIMVSIFNIYYNQFNSMYLSCTVPEHVNIMKTPAILFYIKSAKINDIEASPEHLSYLKNILRYHFHLKELTLSIKSNSINHNTEKEIGYITKAFRERNIIIKAEYL